MGKEVKVDVTLKGAVAEMFSEIRKELGFKTARATLSYLVAKGYAAETGKVKIPISMSMYGQLEKKAAERGLSVDELVQWIVNENFPTPTQLERALEKLK